jgi:N-acetylglutamate synthase-like GNAT family acetyltransferase
MIRLRPATVADLDAANRLIEAAVMTWKLPERVKRLALPSYRYHAYDLDHLDLVVAETSDHRIVGVAAVEPALSQDLPPGQTGLLLHGVYVDPAAYRRGIGTRLLDAAAAAARERGMDGLLVKAQAAAEGFFEQRGLRRLAVVDATRDYAGRYWMPVSPA